MIIGLLLLFITGILWVMQGSVVSNAAAKNLNLSFIQLMMGAIMMICIFPLKFFVDIAVNPITAAALIGAGICSGTAFKLKEYPSRQSVGSILLCLAGIIALIF